MPHAKVTVGSVRFQTSLSCNASHLPENKVTNESDGILMWFIRSKDRIVTGVSEGRWRLVELYPRFDIMDN